MESRGNIVLTTLFVGGIASLHVVILNSQSGINVDIRDAHGRTVVECLEDLGRERMGGLKQMISTKEAWAECKQLIEGQLKKILLEPYSHNFDYKKGKVSIIEI